MSSDDPNPNYRYGNQQGYDSGYYGYPVYNGYVDDKPVVARVPDNKPKITSAVYKQNGRLQSMQSLDQGGLSSDRLAKQPSVVGEEDVIQQEQRRLGNTSAPGEPPIITHIKETIIPSVSPRFEKLQNDLSPAVEGSKDYENKGFESSEAKK